MAHPNPPAGLESRSLRPRQLSLLQTLREAQSELSGQDLHRRLHGERQPHGLATVYRSLKQLQRAGLVRCRKLPNGESVYAPLERDDHHLTCVSCGNSEPLPLCPVGPAGLDLSEVLLQGFKPLFHTFEIHGLCASCQQGQAVVEG